MKIIQKKVCLLGDFAVGKTSLVRRFIEGRFDDKYLSTIGVKISRKKLIRPNYTMNILLWDMSDGKEIQKIRLSYLHGLSGALIICDLTRRESLDSFELYISQVRSKNKNASVVFVANKMDLTEDIVITKEDLDQVSSVLGASYLLTSAKTGWQVNKAFDLLADQLEGQT
jgi:small GTP-binding protein